jgi:hypothetical protein
MADFIEIKTTSNFQELNRAMRLLGEKELPFALALAATRTAQKVRTTLLEQMGRSLDQPTPTTLRSLTIKNANKVTKEARVWFIDSFSHGIPADKYLRPQVFGGNRAPKRMEVALRARGILRGDQWAIPSKDILNQYGNLPGALAMRILSGLGAAETSAGVKANATGSRRSKKKGNARRYFVARIKNIEGIWEVKNSAFGRGIRPVVLFVKKTPSYQPRFEFFEIAQQTVDKNYLDQFIKSIDYVVGKAMPRK